MNDNPYKFHSYFVGELRTKSSKTIQYLTIYTEHQSNRDSLVWEQPHSSRKLEAIQWHFENFRTIASCKLQNPTVAQTPYKHSLRPIKIPSTQKPASKFGIVKTFPVYFRVKFMHFLLIAFKIFSDKKRSESEKNEQQIVFSI
jgi:hypothetical protein